MLNRVVFGVCVNTKDSYFVLDWDAWEDAMDHSRWRKLIKDG